MAEIKVQPSNVRDTGRRIKTHNNNANTYLDQIAASLARLRSTGQWESDAATAFFAKFDRLKAAIDGHRGVIDKYSEHLDKAATDYEKSDQYAHNEAQTIQL